MALFAIPTTRLFLLLAAICCISDLCLASGQTLDRQGPINTRIPKTRNDQTNTPLIVIGFMGGRVAANDRKHREVEVEEDLQRHYPAAMRIKLFSNRDRMHAMAFLLAMLDQNGDGRLSSGEKNKARIVIFGHSWGASETVAFARQLDRLSIPVLLTIQVDSVQKLHEDDSDIPPNVRQAVNFYQSEGLLHGRKSIVAVDPRQTTILGNFSSSYRSNPVSCVGYPWYARAFMHSHIEIENDKSVWDKIEELIAEKAL